MVLKKFENFGLSSALNSNTVRVKISQYLPKIAEVNSWTTGPILGLFVLIWVQFSCRILIREWKFEFWIFWKKFDTFSMASALNTYMMRVKRLFSQNDRSYVLHHWTNTRLVCTHLNAFFIPNPNMAMKIWISIFFWKSWKILGGDICTWHMCGEG